MTQSRRAAVARASLVLSLAALVGGAFCHAAGEASARDLITHQELTHEAEWDGKPVPDLGAFMPAADSAKALHVFEGTLSLTTAEMTTEPEELKARYPFNVFPVVVPLLYDKADAKLFPGFSVSFFTHGDDLVPVNRDVIRPPLGQRTASFWDVVVEPGKTWSERGDRGWSRASFPFALVSSLDGDTRNGVAAFLFKDGAVSELRFQIAQQTQQFMQNDAFTAWGQTAARYTPGGIANLDPLKQSYEREKAGRYPTADWSALEARYGAKAVEGFDSGGKPEGHITSALVVDGTIYYKPAKTAYGEYPYTEGMRFGVWSVSKTLMCGIGMLRLAEKFGEGVFDERLLDYFDQSENNSGHDGWEKVTFGNCLDMATGLGSEGGYWTRKDINNWYYAYTHEDKMKHIFTEDNRPWGPGEQMVYNDEDMWILGVAMDRYLKRKEGPGASILDMLLDEVFKPIEVAHFCTTTTYTPDGISHGTPNWAWGCLPTLDDLAKIADLLHNRGAYKGRQILHKNSVRRLFLEKEKRPLGGRYMMSTWYAAYSDAEGKKYSVPHMSGMGGNIVIMMPNGFTGIRISNQGATSAGAIAAADKLRPFKDFVAGQ